MRSSASLGRVGVEGRGQRLELGHQVGRQPLGQFVDRLLVDLAQAHPAPLVQRRARTSSSSCLTMEPMRSTLAGSFTDSVACAPWPSSPVRRSRGPRRARWRPAGSAAAARAAHVARHVAHGAFRWSSRRRMPRAWRGRRHGHVATGAAAAHDGAPRQQRDQHLRRRERAVAGPQPQLAGVGRVEERDGLERHQGHVAQPGGDRRPRAPRRASPRR